MGECHGEQWTGLGWFGLCPVWLAHVLEIDGDWSALIIERFEQIFVVFICALTLCLFVVFGPSLSSTKTSHYMHFSSFQAPQVS